MREVWEEAHQGWCDGRGVNGTWVDEEGRGELERGRRCSISFQAERKNLDKTKRRLFDSNIQLSFDHPPPSFSFPFSHSLPHNQTNATPSPLTPPFSTPTSPGRASSCRCRRTRSLAAEEVDDHTGEE